eukprot:471630-Pyramimonas_sp.AAC.1
MQHAEASAAGVADEAKRNLAQEEIEKSRIQGIAEKLVSDSQQKAESERTVCRDMADAARREGKREAREQAARENQELRSQLEAAKLEADR